MNATVSIRPAQDNDVSAIARIYDHHVAHGLATFETEPPGVEEMRQRTREILANGFPFVVAECAGAVAGYAYANHYRTRYAYRFCVEDSIYVDAAMLGRGIGRALLDALIAECEKRGFRQMIAVIGDSGNLASVRLHESCGFALTGTFRSVGFKFGRWVDCVLMQRKLGSGDDTLPV